MAARKALSQLVVNDTIKGLPQTAERFTRHSGKHPIATQFIHFSRQQWFCQSPRWRLALMLWLHAHQPCPKSWQFWSALEGRHACCPPPPCPTSGGWSQIFGLLPLFALDCTIDVPAADLASSTWLLPMLNTALWGFNKQEEELQYSGQAELDLTNVRDARKPTVPSMRRKA